MKIIIHDTYPQYTNLVSLPKKERRFYYQTVMIKPYEEMFEIMRLPMDPEAMRCMPLSGRDADIIEMVDSLKTADAWNTASASLEEAARRFEAAGVPLPDKVVLGIFLGNPDVLPEDESITGFGGIPGFIQIVIVPNKRNLDMLPSIVAHEFHHNVLFANAKWSFMDITVAKYLAVEGLAESFAESLYGYESLGPWVKRLAGDELEQARRVIGKALDVKGFGEVRKYMFGDQLASYEGADRLGIPPYSGYAVGYRAVQTFLKKTGISVEEATLLSGEEIMVNSGYFRDV